MSKASCEEVRAAAPELALGIIAGDERARVLAHLSSCSECRREVRRLADAADAFLLLAPTHEPAAGFENTVLARLKTPARRQGIVLLRAAALVLAIAAASGALVLWLTADERELGTHYRHALEEANGDYFGVRAIETLSGSKVGDAFLYTGRTDWIFAVFDRDVRSGVYRAEIETKDAGRVVLDRFRLGPGRITWGRSVEVDLKDAVALHLLGPNGQVLTAAFDP